MLHEQGAAGELTWEGYLWALGKLVSAQLGTVARVPCSEPQRPRCTHSWGWSSAKHFRSVADYLVDPDAAPDPAGARTLNNVRFAKQGAMTRGELMSDAAWYATEHVQEFRKKSDLDACIYAVIEPRGDCMQGLTLHRAWGEKAFEPKDAQLVSLLIRVLPGNLWA